MNNFTFLTNEQIFGKEPLDILRKYGAKCDITDFSILLGGYVSTLYKSKENAIKDRTGQWWTKSPDGYNDAIMVSTIDRIFWNSVRYRGTGARPALPYSSISSIASNAMRGRNGILEVEYGEYPQTIVSEDFARTLEKAYSNRTINQTGKSYTTDSVSYQDENTPFRARTHIEYEYNGRKYIRFVGDSNCSEEILSDDRKIQIDDVYWVEVEPIKWMIDERENIALSKKIIFSGVQFNRERNYKGNFDRTDIKEFMDRYFSKDITPSFSREIIPEEKKQIEAKKEVVVNEQIEALPKEAPKNLLLSNDNVTKEEGVKILELLRTPIFTQMMELLSPKDAVIISLKLGYVDGKYFSTESIAKFLEIEEDEVRETTKKGLLLYKENINEFIDNAVKVVTDQPMVLSLNFNGTKK